MITGDIFRKTEGMLYRHYRFIKKKEKILNEIAAIEKRVEGIKHDIRCVETDVDGIGGIDYSRERVQTSGDLTGIPERQTILLMDEVGRLKRELETELRKKLKRQAKIRELDEKIEHVDYAIRKFDEINKQYIEYRYGEECNFEHISRMLPISSPTARRRREEIVQAVARLLDVS